MGSVPFETNHNVYLLGAGFSRAAGLPLVSDFLFTMQRAARWCREMSRTEDLAAIHHVLELRLSAASACHRVRLNPDNVEDLFSLETAVNHDESLALIQRAISATIHFCQSEYTGYPPVQLSLSGTFTSSTFGDRFSNRWTKMSSAASEDSKWKVPLYDFFVGWLTGLLSGTSAQRDTIITLNYDTLLDSALLAWGHVPDYGLPSNYPTATMAPATNPSGSYPTRALYKLHGSINWIETPDDATNVSILPVDMGSGFFETPVLVPPTWGKSFSRPLSQVWDAAAKALSTATRLVVIGFSMPETDIHMRYLLAASLRENACLQSILFIDPNPRTVRRAAEVLFSPQFVASGGIRYVPESVTAEAFLRSHTALTYLNRPLSAPHVTFVKDTDNKLLGIGGSARISRLTVGNRKWNVGSTCVCDR